MTGQINLTDTPTVTQTNFTQIQELVTKLYVDDNSGGSIKKPNNCIVAGVLAGASLTTGDNNILLALQVVQKLTTGVDIIML